jgi:hypothetical protein
MSYCISAKKQILLQVIFLFTHLSRCFKMERVINAPAITKNESTEMFIAEIDEAIRVSRKSFKYFSSLGNDKKSRNE